MAGKLAEALVRAGVLAADAYDIEEELGLRAEGSVNLTASIRSDGGIPKSTGPVVVIAKSLAVDSVGLAAAGAQKLDETKISAGDLSVGDHIRITMGLAKSGASDTCSFAVKLGKGRTSSDASILSGPSFTSAQKSAGLIAVYRVTSLTSVRLIGAMSSISPLASASTLDSPADVTVPDLSTDDTWLSVYATMGAGAEAPALRGLLIELIRG